MEFYTPDSDAFSNFLSVAMAEANHDDSQRLMNNLVVLVQDCFLLPRVFLGHQGIGTDYVWFTEDLSHSAARAIERELSGGRSKAAAGLNRNMLPTRETAGRHEEYSTNTQQPSKQP